MLRERYPREDGEANSVLKLGVPPRAEGPSCAARREARLDSLGAFAGGGARLD